MAADDSSSGRIWHRLTVRAVAPLADAVGSHLLDLGAPGLESGEDGDTVLLTAHFAAPPAEDALESLFDALAESFPAAPRPTCERSQITESNWAENWKDHFPPLEVGERLFIHPPWVSEIPGGRIPIAIDPGMAFGTGHHASTRGCLVLLERLCRTAAPARVLDIGTGSGVLAIAAAKLGATAVRATDNDPLACDIARANVAANGTAACVAVELGTAPRGQSFELVLANLLAGDLIRLAATLAALLARRGTVIGSGLTEDEAAAVRAAWVAQGLAPRDTHSEQGWVTLAYQKAGLRVED